MLKPLFLSLCALFVFGTHANAQLTNGLVAHWRMNGNTNDATGTGHIGIPYNVIPAKGKYGVDSTAMQFAGDTGSYILVPYQSDINVTSYSICAVVKPLKLYTALCQVNQLFIRGNNGLSSHYSLFFTDNAYDSSCNITNDTTRYCFYAGANTSDMNGGVSFGVHNKPWQYTPNIRTNVWYTVVATFTGNTFKLYVDGVLKVTSVATAPNIPLTSSTDGIAIGNNVWSKMQYPYSFNGLIDDMRLYNRVLSDSEVVQYHNIVDTPVTISVGELSTIGDVSLFPNPSTGNFTLEGAVNAPSVNIEVLNTLGQVVYKDAIATRQNMLGKYISLDEGLINGLYLVKLQAEGDTRIFKFTLQR